MTNALQRLKNTFNQMDGWDWQPYITEPWFNKAFSNTMPTRMWETEATTAEGVLSHPGQIHFEIDLPGINKDAVTVSVKDRILTVTATRQKTKTSGKDTFEETSYGRIERVFSLPQTIDEDSCDATLKDGVLSVTFTKSQKPNGKQITVK